MLAKGTQAPEFCLPNQSNEKVCLQDYKGKWVVLYFYPKDNTSGCTQEAIDFTEFIDEFEQLDSIVLGVSPDSVKSHQNFISKHDLKVVLLSDPDHSVLQQYGVWQKKTMYGREYMGVVRSTYLVDPDGVIRDVWEKVKVNGHADAVKCQLQDYH